MEPVVIANQLLEISMYFEISGDRYRAAAYRRAAESVGAASGLARLIDAGQLEQLPHVGVSTARVIADLARRGNSAVLDQLRQKWPSVVVELARLPYVGVAKARALYEALAPNNLDSVAAACRAGAVRGLKGFGELSESKLLAAIEDHQNREPRMLHVDAEAQANAIATYLRHDPTVVHVEIAGPVRRWLEVVDHFSFAVGCHAPTAVIERFHAYARSLSVDQGGDLVHATLADGMRCELYLAPPHRFGWALVRATGSPEHVEQLRTRRSDIDTIEAATEADLYRALDLPYPPPEVRDGTDEFAKPYSNLITLADVTTAFHCHTTYSDGEDSVLAMAHAAHQMGMRAITVTDHSAAATYAGGLNADRLREQAREIAALDAPIQILHGTEADILADGSIDVPPDLVRSLDLVIASIHQRHKLDEDAMTQRLITAMRQPYFKIWGHALGRLVLRREPIRVRIDDILDAIAQSPAAIELNGDPYRLDLDPENAARAASLGIPFVVSCDAHSTSGLNAMRWAVALARRARIPKSQILNALEPEELAERIAPVNAVADERARRRGRVDR